MVAEADVAAVDPDHPSEWGRREPLTGKAAMTPDKINTCSRTSAVLNTGADAVVLDAPRIRLRPVMELDLEVLCRIRNDRPLQHMLLGNPRTNDLDDVRKWVEHRLNDPQALFFVIAERAIDEVIGFCQVVEIAPDHGHGLLGIAIIPERQGCGFGREAVSHLMTYLRDHVRLHKVCLMVRADNTAALSLYRTLGFQTVGIYREHYLCDGIRYDVVAMEVYLSR
jgi:RimJ/RimL family protein N-acetyltransferase